MDFRTWDIKVCEDWETCGCESCTDVRADIASMKGASWEEDRIYGDA